MGSTDVKWDFDGLYMYYEGDGKHLLKRFGGSLYTVQFNLTDPSPEANVIINNEPKLRKALLPMIKFLVNTMLHFELEVNDKWGATDSQLFNNAYAHKEFRYMVHSAAEKDMQKRK